jgi:hypothetical protein
MIVGYPDRTERCYLRRHRPLHILGTGRKSKVKCIESTLEKPLIVPYSLDLLDLAANLLAINFTLD